MYFPVDTRRRFNVDTTSYDIVRRRIDVETTSCLYGVACLVAKNTKGNERLEDSKKES